MIIKISNYVIFLNLDFQLVTLETMKYFKMLARKIHGNLKTIKV